MIFSTWIGYFEYVGYLPHGIMLISINVSILIAVNCSWSTQSWSIVQWEISSVKLRKPLLTRSMSHNTSSIHDTNLFLHFSWVFTFIEIKHNMLKMLLFSSIFNITMATQNFTNFGKFFFLIHADTTAVTIQSNKIVSNEVKDN